jgi:hypothetical protein
MATERSNYLYGDSTESALKSNFLEFLRDAIDFSVAALKSDQRIDKARARIEALKVEAARHSADLEAFVTTVTGAIESAPKEADSPTMQCATHLESLSRDALATFKNVIAGKLQADIAQAEAEERAARQASLAALGALLAPHDPPDSTSSSKIALNDAGVYEGASEGSSPLGLSWSMSLSAPAGHAWSEPVRLGKYVPGFEVPMPQVVSGWLGKGVKVMPAKLDGFIVTEFSDTGTTANIGLRSDTDASVAFQLEIQPKLPAVKMTRLGGAAAADLPAEVELKPEEVQRLIELPAKLNASSAGFVAGELSVATVDDQPFRELPTFRSFVERLMTMMAPVTRIISERSLMPTELVIRKLLGNDRREEIFVAKAVLREKYASLPEEQRALFTPLGLEPSPRTTDLPAGISVRAELAPSRPPPPMPVPTANTVVVSTPPTSDASKTEGIKPSMRKIIALAKGGDTDGAYREYATLFRSSVFTHSKTEEQRASLRFFLLGKLPTEASPSLQDAYRAALPATEHLLTQAKEPGDYELLGVCQNLLADKEAARKAFQAGLSIELERDAASEQCTSLRKRLSELE